MCAGMMRTRADRHAVTMKRHPQPTRFNVLSYAFRRDSCGCFATGCCELLYTIKSCAIILTICLEGDSKDCA